MKPGTSMKSTLPEGSKTGRAGTRPPRGDNGASESVTTASSRREQQRRLESCKPAEVHQRNKKRTNTRRLPPPKFLRGLVRAVTDRSDVIAFKNGSVTVKDHAVLVSEVLPKFFKASTTLKSFLRQLNYFDFKKVTGKGVNQPEVFHNETLEGKGVHAIIHLKRREPRKSNDESTTTVKSEPPRLPRSAGPSVFAREAAIPSAVSVLVTSGSRAHNIRVPPPSTTRSTYLSSPLLPPLVDASSGVAVAPTRSNIRGYASSPRVLTTEKSDRDITIRHGWGPFDARSDHSTSDANHLPPVSFAARDGSGTADRSGSRDGNVGESGNCASDGNSNLGMSAAKRKPGEHFEGGAVAAELLQSKRACRYVGRYCSNPAGLRSNGSHRGVIGRGSGGNARAAGEEASRQLLSLAETKSQQHPRTLLADRPHLGVPGPSREGRSSFVSGYDHGRDDGRIGVPLSSKKSTYSVILPHAGLAWPVQPVTPCTGPTAFVRPPSTSLQSGCGLRPEMVMSATAGRSSGTGSVLRDTCAELGFSTDPDRFPAAEKVGSTTPAVCRGACMRSTIGGIDGDGGGLCSEFRGNRTSPFSAEAVFGPFFAVEGDVSPDCLDKCFMSERALPAPGREGLAEPGNGGNDFDIGLFHDYSC